MQNTVRRLAMLIVALPLAGCSPLAIIANPIIGASSLAHSIVTGNTLGVITGTGSMAIESATGKSPTEHVWNAVKHRTESRPVVNTSK